jgi:hypothetical protein
MKRQKSCGPRLGKLVHQLPGSKLPKWPENCFEPFVGGPRYLVLLSFVQVLRLALGSEGAPNAKNVMGPNDGDGSEYIPH